MLPQPSGPPKSFLLHHLLFSPYSANVLKIHLQHSAFAVSNGVSNCSLTSASCEIVPAKVTHDCPTSKYSFFVSGDLSSVVSLLECKSQVQVVTYVSDPPWIEGSHNPLLSSINFLEWLLAFRKTVYLLDYPFISCVAARWKRCLGQGVWNGGQSFQALIGRPTLPIHARVY